MYITNITYEGDNLMKTLIRQVAINKNSGQKFIYLPLSISKEINPGDYVKITKVDIDAI